MPLCRYALAVCLCAAATAHAQQQTPPAPPDAEMNSAIEEFKIQTRNLGLRADSPPKAGRHSPLLDWHGRIFENFRNDALDAVPHEIRQNGGDKGLLRRNQFGFNVAGPAVLPHLIEGRNTYFSLSYEGVREDIARTYLQTIPTMAQRTGDYSDVVDDAGNVIPIYDPASTQPNPSYDPTQPVLAGEHQPLIDYERLGREALLSIPTPDHYLPLLYVIASRQPGEVAGFPVEGVDGGSISMLAVKIG
jgi:hypothetical protein